MSDQSKDLVVLAKECNVEVDVYRSLQTSLYPKVPHNLLVAVASYCRARNIDLFLKPVHIMPIDGKDVVVPGIGMFRILATRTGQYLGMDEPVFGPEITEKLGSVTITYPQWCKITVKKLVAGQVCNFTAMEFWKENYGQRGSDPTPNKMWQKRVYGQLAKCTEAQALRKAFPDTLGQEYSYEELEGKADERQQSHRTYEHAQPQKKDKQQDIIDVLDYDEAEVNKHIDRITSSTNLEELHSNFRVAYLKFKDVELARNLLVITKDERKNMLMMKAEEAAKDAIESQVQENIFDNDGVIKVDENDEII